MFSCCRPNNPKNPKSSKKDKGKKGGGADGTADPEPTEKKLIIPTITIESNGNGTVGENSAADSGDEVGDVNGDVEEVTTAAAGEAVKVTPTSESASTRSMHDESGGEEGVTAADPKDTNRSCEAIVELSDRNDELSKSSPPTSCTDESVNTVINQYTMASNTDTEATASPIPSLAAAGGHLVSGATATNGCPQRDTDTDTDAATINEESEMAQQNGHPPPPVSCGGQADAEPVTAAEQELANEERHKKSCLSRHNSTHTSIKKKVNISVHAEIIEPDPLPPPPYDRLSLGDDDDVFSDSIPPPKRDSMCAPYIPETDEMLVFGHGLPEWFNDERINDIGCIEPPVTPVGRDELELKRQRLYTDLLRAAHAAVEHNVRFTPLCDLDGVAAGTAAAAAAASQAAALKLDATGTAVGGGGGGGRDCDPDLKSSVAENLEHLVNRLERLVERLERSVSARELEIANRAFDSVLEKKRESFDLESTELPPLPVCTLERELSQHTESLSQRIQRIETSLTRINDSHSNTNSQSVSLQQQQQQSKGAGSLENIPTTVLEDYTNDEAYPPPPPPQQLEEAEEQQPTSMSVYGYQDIMTGPLAQYLALSAKIGGDVATHANSVKAAFDAQLQYVTLATEISKPSADKQMELLKPTSDQISAIQDFREKRRTSPFFNHLSAISESIPALGWVCVSPTPGPHVKEMNDAGQFYTNRVLKEWKEKDTTHVEWARAWVQTLTELQAYIKQHHTTGLVWSGKGNAPSGGFAPPPPPIGGCPPPPPPPAFDLSQDAGTGDERSALFAEINQGEAITKNLKKVTADMQTHKNPTLRTGPAPFKPTQVTMGKGPAPAPPAAAAKAPVFTRDGKKWLIEYQKNNTGLLVEGAEMNNVVYVFRCEGSTLTVKGKVNNIVLDSCKKCSLLFDSVVASVEFVNCQSVQMQALGHVPTISVDKTDGCQMYLSSESLGVEVVSSKSSEMNVMLPEAGGDYTELAVPEQFKTTIQGKTLKTVCVDSLG